MKKYLLCFSIFLSYHGYIYAQVKSNGYDNGTVVIQSLQEINSFSGNVNQFFVADTAAGGFFSVYRGNMPVDNGIIFKDGKGVKWKRYIPDGRIRPEWFGAGATVTDNYEAFMKAINYIYATYNSSGGTIPPYSNAILQLSGIRYNFKKTLVFNNHIKIEGLGTRYEPTSILYFPANTTGLKFIPTPTGGSYSADVKNIMVGMDYTNQFDSNAHAISIKCVVNFENVTVNFASGNGIHIDACANNGAPNYGNSDGSSFVNCKVQSSNNGVYIHGCDANQMVFQSLWAVANRRWGIYDDGFLGNHYYNPQCDFNGNNQSVVTYGKNPVKYYLAINAEELVNLGRPPDAVNSEYWREVPTRAASPWNPGRRYYTGGAYAIVNINAYATVFGAYTEEGEAPALLNNRVITIGGDQGSGVVGGKYLFANNEGLVVTSNLILTGQHKLGIGTAPFSPLDISYRYKDNYINNIARFRCDDCESTNMIFQNSADDFGVFGYYGKGFLTMVSRTPITLTDSLGFRPFVGNKFNLGSASYRWNNIYADNWRGGVIMPAYGGTGLGKLKANGLLFGGATETSPLQQLEEPGSVGQVLTSNGPGKIPSWKTSNGENNNGSFALPIMTTAERNNIKKPTEGSMIYNKTTHKLNIFTGIVWEQVSSN